MFALMVAIVVGLCHRFLEEGCRWLISMMASRDGGAEFYLCDKGGDFSRRLREKMRRRQGKWRKKNCHHGFEGRLPVILTMGIKKAGFVHCFFI